MPLKARCAASQSFRAACATICKLSYIAEAPRAHKLDTYDRDRPSTPDSENCAARFRRSGDFFPKDAKAEERVHTPTDAEGVRPHARAGRGACASASAKARSRPNDVGFIAEAPAPQTHHQFRISRAPESDRPNHVSLAPSGCRRPQASRLLGVSARLGAMAKSDRAARNDCETSQRASKETSQRSVCRLIVGSAGGP